VIKNKLLRIRKKSLLKNLNLKIIPDDIGFKAKIDRLATI
jgi:hypothetical protein